MSQPQPQPPSHPHQPMPVAPLSALSISHPCYFPSFSRELSEFHLRSFPAGSFLIRPSSHAGSLVISLQQGKKIAHFLLQFRNSGWVLESSAWSGHDLGNRVFPDVSSIVEALRVERFLSVGVRRDVLMPTAAPVMEKSLSSEKRENEEKRDLQQYLKSSSIPDGLGPLHSPADSASFQDFEYKGMLAAVLSNNRPLTAGDVSMLAEWRTRNSFSHERHDKILENLGRREEFLERCRNLSAQMTEEPAERPADSPADCCVCLSATRNCVFIPCGHFCACLACAASLDECVLCRAAIEKFQKVFIA